MNTDNLVYFQDHIYDKTLVKGYINKETKQGRAEIYKKTDVIAIDLEESGVKKNPYLNKEYAAKFAFEALKIVEGK